MTQVPVSRLWRSLNRANFVAGHQAASIVYNFEQLHNLRCLHLLSCSLVSVHEVVHVSISLVLSGGSTLSAIGEQVELQRHLDWPTLTY